MKMITDRNLETIVNWLEAQISQSLTFTDQTTLVTSLTCVMMFLLQVCLSAATQTETDP